MDGAAVEAVADLARRYQDANTTEGLVEGDPSVSLRRVRDDEATEVLDVERYLPTPRRARGDAILDQPDSFAEYVSRLHVAGETPTTMWACLDERQVVAVFNDHATDEAPGWRDHRATFGAQVDQDWRDWRSLDGKLVDQRGFAEFIEEHLHSIVQPDDAPQFPSAANMLVVSRSLTAASRQDFKSSTRLDSGDVAFSFSKETQASTGRSDVEVPERFLVAVSPFVGHPPVRVEARLRYRADEGGLRIGYKLLRPDLAERVAFEEITREIAAGTPEDVPLLWGRAPGATQSGPLSMGG